MFSLQQRLEEFAEKSRKSLQGDGLPTEEQASASLKAGEKLLGEEDHLIINNYFADHHCSLC